MTEHHHESCRAITPDQFRRLCEEFRAFTGGAPARLDEESLPERPRLSQRQIALHTVLRDLDLCLHIDKENMKEWLPLLDVNLEMLQYLFPEGLMPPS